MPVVFKLQLSALGSGEFEARLVESPAGEPRHLVELPFDPPATAALLQVLEKGDLTRCSLDGTQHAALESLGVVKGGHLQGTETRSHIVGQRLFQALFPADPDPNRNLRGALETAMSLAQAGGGAIRFQLRFDHDAVDLASLPWELLCDGAGRHLVAAGLLQFTRYITFGQAITPFPVADRLDVLVVTPRPEDSLPLDAEPERGAIGAAFRALQAAHRVQIQRLDPPTWEALVRTVNARPYGIVHFDGHGVLARRCPVCEELQPASVAHCMNPGCSALGTRLDESTLTGCLAFERSAADRTGHLVDGADLAHALTGRNVRLFVASACQTAMVGGTSVFSGVAPRLIQAGVPAVVAMQFSLPPEPAARFVAEFYAALARGESIAAATSAGRGVLVESGLWYIPAVYLRSRDGEGFVFRSRGWHYLQPAGAGRVDWAALRPADAAPYKFLSPYEITDHIEFHGREDDTRRVLGEMLHRRYAVLFGPPSVGKTSLVNAGLAPALIDRGWLVLIVQASADPVAALRQQVSGSGALEIDLPQDAGLAGVIAAVQEGTGRPVAVILDEFDRFLAGAGADRQQAFARQLAAYAGQEYVQSCCVLLVLGADAVGRLQSFRADLPDIFQSLVALDPLTRAQARRAIEEPLKGHQPPMAFDSAFLARLLADLCPEAGVDAINPAHLQIVCHELYQAARQRGVETIDGSLYPEEGTREFLGRALEQSLGRLGPDRQDPARALLKQMVGGPGERLFVTPAGAASGAGSPLPEAQAILDALQRDGLLEARISAEGELTYSLSHHLLAEEVHGWFDREEALDRLAQQALERAWHDWFEQSSTPPGEAAGAGPRLLLVAPDRLREIQARRERVEIGAPQVCLLLRSAVHHGCDVGYWAGQVARHERARHLLGQVQQGQVDALPGADRREALLCARALGLAAGAPGAGALAVAAVAPAAREGHAAALALGALGLDALQAAQPALAQAAHGGQSWRRLRALAWIRAAGRPLPALSWPVQSLVAVWAAGLTLWDHRQQVGLEAVAAGLGAGLGLGLGQALGFLVHLERGLGGFSAWLMMGVSLVPIGAAAGTLAVLGAWLAVCWRRPETGRGWALARVAGFWLGFVLALVLFWLPIELLARAVRVNPAAWDPAQKYLLVGSTWALGTIVGREALARVRRGPAWGRALLGGGLGGAIGCALPAVLGISGPLVELPAAKAAPLVALARAAEAVLAGFGLGGGLAVGWELGSRLQDWLSVRQGESLGKAGG